MQDAIRLVVTKSPAAAALALATLRAVKSNASTAQANFSEQERALLSEHITFDTSSGSRDQVLQLRVTLEEKTLVMQKASDAGMTLSDYLREVLSL